MKTENWNGYLIRFVREKGEWWSVAKDVTDALGFRDANVALKRMAPKYKSTAWVDTPKGCITSKARHSQEMLVLNEKGLYRLIMRSNKPEAEAFQDWVYDIIKTLRQASGLEGFEIFRLLDKEHQRKMMAELQGALHDPPKTAYIKANTIANKCVSLMYGFPKMISKAEMSPEMLVKREAILDAVVKLMGITAEYELPVHVSAIIYKKYGAK